MLECQCAEATDPAPGGTSRIPVCAWADQSALGCAGIPRQNAAGSVELPLHVAADHIATLRAASLVEIAVSPAD